MHNALEHYGIQVHKTKPLAGGSINSVHKVTDTHGKSFVVKSNANVQPDFFEAEKHGLETLRKHAKKLTIPGVVGTFSEEDTHFLVLEYLEPGSESATFSKHLGIGLAEMHQTTQVDFSGLDRNNYIGSMRQKNAPFSNFYDFFGRKRLYEPFKLIEKKGIFGTADHRALERLMMRLPELIPDEKSSLLHGDLWTGNKLALSDGSACILDPAIYYGHREIDLAMTRLFGGFSIDFYNSYNEVYPLAPQWEKRVDIFNLYPLLVHTLLFGGSYAGQVAQILRRYGG